MKKLKYIQPQSEIVKIQTIKMLASSFNNGESANLDEITEEGDGGDAASRDYYDWGW